MTNSTNATFGLGRLANVGLLADDGRAGARQACSLTVRLKLILVALLAVFAFAALAGSASAVLPQQAAADAAAEAQVEAAEESEEQAEEAAASASLDNSVAQLRPFQTRLIAAFTRHTEHLKWLITQIREGKKIDRTLPHTTTRWLVHLPKKRTQIKELRAKVRALRVRMQEARST